MMPKKILVCGASGFIGRNLFETLSAKPGLEVYGTYLQNMASHQLKPHNHLQKADLTDKALAKMVTKNMDVVINTAAITDGSGSIAYSPAKYIADNIRINTNLIESSYENKVPHFIFLSCSIVYPAKNCVPVKETGVDISKIHPKYFMGARIKIFAEDMCRFFAELGDTRFTIVRHSNIYGPHDKFDTTRGHVFAATMAKVMATDKVVVWGNGSEKRDLLHVSDLVKAFESVIDREPNIYDVFNIGSGQSVTVGELVSKINSISSMNLPIQYDTSRPTIDTNIILDITKAKDVLGWHPQVDLDSGIWQTIDWYLKNKGS